MVWAVLFLVSGAIISIGSNTFRNFIRYLDACIIPMLLYMAAFYLNYYFFIDKYLFPERRMPVFLLLNSVVMVLADLALTSWNILRVHFLPQSFVIEDTNILYITTNITLLLVIVLSISIKSILNWNRVQSEKQILEKEHTKAELRKSERSAKSPFPVQFIE